MATRPGEGPALSLCPHRSRGRAINAIPGTCVPFVRPLVIKGKVSKRCGECKDPTVRGDNPPPGSSGDLV